MWLAGIRLSNSTDVLSHRLVLTYEALADAVSAPSIVERVLQVVLPPQIAPSQLQSA